MKIIHTLQASPHEVMPYLADPDLFASVHPVIYDFRDWDKNIFDDISKREK